MSFTLRLLLAAKSAKSELELDSNLMAVIRS